jgi:hypothetical protein
MKFRYPQRLREQISSASVVSSAGCLHLSREASTSLQRHQAPGGVDRGHDKDAGAHLRARPQQA